MARRHLCVDGKVARGTWEADSQRCALTTVSLFASELRLVLSSGRVAPKGGEKHLALSLLELLDLQDAVITGDAAYCQSEAAALIHQSQADYVFTLKTSQPKLFKRVQAAFEASPEWEGNVQSEEGHGRIESRLVQSRSVAELGLEPSLIEKWPGLQSVVRVERQREVKSGLKAGQKSHKVWFYLSSLVE